MEERTAVSSEVHSNTLTMDNTAAASTKAHSDTAEPQTSWDEIVDTDIELSAAAKVAISKREAGISI